MNLNEIFCFYFIDQEAYTKQYIRNLYVFDLKASLCCSSKMILYQDQVLEAKKEFQLYCFSFSYIGNILSRITYVISLWSKIRFHGKWLAPNYKKIVHASDMKWPFNAMNTNWQLIIIGITFLSQHYVFGFIVFNLKLIF